ncbi:MAG: hypothetical protein HYS13_21775 [Planctomycetia bacterium]|nr:hypothetical protein [Planctomycetia bacterium]
MRSSSAIVGDFVESFARAPAQEAQTNALAAALQNVRRFNGSDMFDSVVVGTRSRS